MKFVAWAKLSPSEDPAKVSRALGELMYPEDRVKTEEEDGRIVLKAEGISSLRKIRDMAASRRVRSVLKRLLMYQVNRGSFELLLNRQALTRGVISFCESDSESPLGAVHVEIITDDPRALVSYIAPV